VQFAVDSSGQVTDDAASRVLHQLQSFCQSSVFRSQLVQFGRQPALSRRERVVGEVYNLSCSRVVVTLIVGQCCLVEDLMQTEYTTPVRHRRKKMPAGRCQIIVCYLISSQKFVDHSQESP